MEESASHLQPVGLQSHSVFAKAKHPVTLKFEDVVYTIKRERKSGLIGCAAAAGGKEGGTSSGVAEMGVEEGSSRSRKKLMIIKGVSGVVSPGEMLALMGPSGSGKTTLLTALGGRLLTNDNTLTGTITYNGRPISSSMRRSIGFVTQDDVLYPHLTVFETLLYAALLRLPSTLGKQQKIAQAEGVMAELGLTTCRNSIIGGGSSMLRGLSGGERKRVSIGQEMLINPSLLFLDEPTSGLDSTTAHKIVTTLSEMTSKMTMTSGGGGGGGRTVVLTIHQPSSSIFSLFHKLLLLSDGSPVYFGKAAEAMDYFASIGYAPSVRMVNPADFILDLANGNSHASNVPILDDGSAAVKDALTAAYNLHLKERLKEELQAGNYTSSSSNITLEYKQGNEMATADDDNWPTNLEWATGWWEQFKVLLERGIKERRHEAFSGLKITQILAVALVSGALWWHSGHHLQDQVGFLFFVTGFWSLFPVYQAIFTFPQERMMLTKERTSKMYRLSSYFMARLVGDLPMELALPIIFTIIAYWMAGLKPYAANFFVTLSVMLLNVLVAQGIGLALGALIMDLKSATTLAAVIMQTFFLTGGFYVQKVPKFIAWIKYISPTFYSFKLLTASQFSPGDTYHCAPTVTCKVEEFPAIAVVGFGHEYVAIVVLSAYLIFCRLISYIALMRVGSISY